MPFLKFSFTGNNKSFGGTGATKLHGKDCLRFYAQWQTVTSLWQSDDAVSTAASVDLPT